MFAGLTRFYGFGPAELLALPWRLFQLYARNLPKVQAAETLQMAWAMSLAFSGDQGMVDELRRAAGLLPAPDAGPQAQPGEAAKPAKPKRRETHTASGPKASRAELLRMATDPRWSDGVKVIRRAERPAEAGEDGDAAQ